MRYFFAIYLILTIIKVLILIKIMIFFMVHLIDSTELLTQAFKIMFIRFNFHRVFLFFLVVISIFISEIVLIAINFM